MALREEIKPYVDSYGLVAPYRIPPGTIRGSDNGTLFLSEYHIILDRAFLSSPMQVLTWERAINSCMLLPGLTVRNPGDTNSDSHDNQLGILSAAEILGVPEIAKQILRYGRKHWGWFNPGNPGSIYVKGTKNIYWECFLWRMPHLYIATVAVAGKLRFWHLPGVIYTALFIVLNNYKLATSSTTPRLNVWHLIQCMSPHSKLCEWAAKRWYKQLYQDYPDGMQGVARVYFEKDHPFQNHEWDNDKGGI